MIPQRSIPPLRRVRRQRLGVALLVVGLLAGCAALDPPREVPAEPELAWADLRERLDGISAWQAEGRLAVRTVDDGGNAGFTWRETDRDGFSLRLTGAWGQGVVRLSGNGQGARLETADDRIHYGHDAAVLLSDLYGWSIPVTGLRGWLIGLPAGGTDDDAQYTLDRFGRLATLEWQDWAIEYRRYRIVDDLDLPAELVARSTTLGMELRMAVDRWRIGTAVDPAPGRSTVPLIGG